MTRNRSRQISECSSITASPRRLGMGKQWICRRPMNVMRNGAQVRVRPGDPVPEAASWGKKSPWIRKKYAVEVEEEEVPPPPSSLFEEIAAAEIVEPAEELPKEELPKEELPKKTTKKSSKKKTSKKAKK